MKNPLLKKATFLILGLLSINLAAAKFGDSPEEILKELGDGVKGKALGTDFETLTFKKDNSEIVVAFSYQGQCVRYTVNNCESMESALEWRKKLVPIAFKDEFSNKDNSFKGAMRSGAREIVSEFKEKEKTLIITDNTLLRKTEEMGQGLTVEQMKPLLPAIPMLGESIGLISNTCPNGRESTEEDGVIKIAWGTDNGWDEKYQIEAFFTPTTQLCFCITIHRGLEDCTFSREQAFLISKVLFPEANFKVTSDKKDIRRLKGEAFVKNNAKNVTMNYEKFFSNYWSLLDSKMTFESKELAKLRDSELKKLSQSKGQKTKTQTFKKGKNL